MAINRRPPLDPEPVQWEAEQTCEVLIRTEKPSAGLYGGIIGAVPKKPPAKASPLAKERFYAISINDGIYLVDADELNLYQHLDATNEGVYSKKQIPFGEIPGKLKVLGTARVEGVVSRVEDAPSSATSTGVEQTVVDELIRKATKVLGTRDEAMRWLGTPVRALNFATPISIAGTKEGVERVNDVLGQMEYGIW